MDYHQPLYPDGLYHVLSRANGSELLFRNQDNYAYFLRRYLKYINPVAKTLAWALLPNHFHFLVRIENTGSLLRHYLDTKGDYPQEAGWASVLVMQQFSNLLNSYAKTYNKLYDRKGALFIDYLRRVPIEDESQLLNTLFYIHNNPVHHRLCGKMEQWKWTSFHEFLSSGNYGFVNKKEVMKLFSDKDSFIRFHSQAADL
jgi:putative transposase